MDEEIEAMFDVQEISHETIGQDFKRNHQNPPCLENSAPACLNKRYGNTTKPVHLNRLCFIVDQYLDY